MSFQKKKMEDSSKDQKYQSHTPPLPPPGLKNTLGLSDKLIAYLQQIEPSEEEKQHVLPFTIQTRK